ncbi:hypothetical protein JAAARDRAFT_189568 [Jaapia argillacea MUCL 33604]|uniref:Endonuclease/exonuclease/phosphatase domain-containing protein n=1 Tax=Jaapia argillacea MUCL 33604 TaxID=933084 RepID=A0A067QFC9_9AGAM|nr:hypothetical protein JAAARDRAFT_189568 [Jaapia argillacea MUCL 33604]
MSWVWHTQDEATFATNFTTQIDTPSSQINLLNGTTNFGEQQTTSGDGSGSTAGQAIEDGDGGTEGGREGRVLRESGQDHHLPSRGTPDEEQRPALPDARLHLQANPSAQNHLNQPQSSNQRAAQSVPSLQSATQDDSQSNEGEAHPNRRKHRRAQKAAHKASVRIASLNLKGYGNTNPTHKNNKWNHLNQLLREQKIAVLLVQEAHMTEERRDNVERVFSKRM